MTPSRLSSLRTYLRSGALAGGLTVVGAATALAEPPMSVVPPTEPASARPIPLDDRGPGERAGTVVDEAGDKAAAEARKAGRKVKRGTRKAVKKTGEAVEETGRKMEDSTR